MRSRKRRLSTRQRVLVVSGVVAAIAIVTLASATSLSWPSSASPRLVTGSPGTVQQTLSVTGTIQTAGEADLSFGTAGQVSAVMVEAGRPLTTIDSVPLQRLGV